MTLWDQKPDVFRKENKQLDFNIVIQKSRIYTRLIDNTTTASKMHQSRLTRLIKVHAFQHPLPCYFVDLRWFALRA